MVKYDSSGTKKWTQVFGTSEYENALSVKADTSGIYVTGFTKGNLDGKTNSGSTGNSASNLSKNDIFLVKFNSDGVKQ